MSGDGPDAGAPVGNAGGGEGETLVLDGIGAGAVVCIDPRVDPDAHLPITDRYLDLGPLGQGAMGEVLRVHDTALHRHLAMKRVHPGLAHNGAAATRFLAEAQITAQLQHPAIIPVHDLGQHADGRLWFTMKEVRGRTLADGIAQVHAEGCPDSGLRRLVAALLTVCRAVAYAHERDVVHRDLKPANIMLGAHGEIYVLDWGLAKVHGAPVHASDDAPAIHTARDDRYATRAGQVAGTPAYMSPEQAAGDVASVDARSDVYGLGAILYELLAGAPPYSGTARDVLAAALAGPPPPVGAVASWSVPELEHACERAMARVPAARFATAGALADALEAWLDGAQRHTQAVALTEAALRDADHADRLLAEEATLRAEAEALLAGVAAWEPAGRKHAGWDKHAEADAARRSATSADIAVDEGLQAALRIEPRLVQAHAALAERWLRRHQEAEAARDPDGVFRAERALVTHSEALPASHAVRTRVQHYLRGDGALCLLTDPPGAEVLLYRFVDRRRRSEPVFERSLGVTPLVDVPVGMGSYLCRVRHPGHDDVRYPVRIERGTPWSGVAPGESTPRPIRLPPEGSLRADEIYVPAGPFQAGGDPTVTAYPASAPWCDGFVMQRHPVTNRDYLALLNDLVRQGRVDEAVGLAPSERGSPSGAPGAMIYGFDGSRFSLQPDADGDLWGLDWPVIHVDWFGARAYLRWLSAQTGQAWQLPHELAWEKAARGVDGRAYPWGDDIDPSWCNMSKSHAGRPMIEPVTAFPDDISLYGVRGLAGNVQDWCDNPFELDAQAPPPAVVPTAPSADESPDVLRANRGGAWMGDLWHCRVAQRYRATPQLRDPTRGIRGLRWVPHVAVE